MRVTIKDIAGKAGVSKTTVSFAFNEPQRISRDTRARIMKIAEQMGYVPDPVARRLATRRLGTVGLLLPQPVAEVFRNPYTAELLQGVGEVCQREGLTISLIPPVEGMLSLAVREAMVDAFILLGIGLDRRLVQLIRHRHLSFVTVDGDPAAGVPNVGIDDERAAFTLMEHVLSLGHRRVQIMRLHGVAHTLSDAGGSRTAERRLAGFRLALKAHRLRITDVRVHSCEGSVRAAAATARRILGTAAPERPTAVVCMSDVAAYGVYQACGEMRIDIPRELSVAGFDDLPISPVLSPALTTVRQPGFEKGRQAALLMAGLLNGRQGVSKTLAAELVVRGSTTAPVAAPSPVQTDG